MKKPELLAPAGTFERAKIAYLYGADAVYAGTADLSLRTRVNINNDEFVKFVREMWNNISFVNFSQNFESRCTGNNFCDSDLTSFKEYIKSINSFISEIFYQITK